MDSKECLIIFLFKSTGSIGSTCFVGGSILGSTLALQALRVLWAHRHTHLIPNVNNTEAYETGGAENAHDIFASVDPRI